MSGGTPDLRGSVVAWTGAHGTHTSYLGAPRLSPDGSMVAYSGYNSGNVVHVVDAGTGEFVRTIGDSEYWFKLGDWLPDGSLLVERTGALTGIYRVSADFTTMERIDPTTSTPERISASRSGKIAYVINGSELWTMNADGSDPVRFGSGLIQGGYPAWSPDGKYLALSSSGKLRVINMTDGTSTEFADHYVSQDTRMDWR